MFAAAARTVPSEEAESCELENAMVPANVLLLALKKKMLPEAVATLTKPVPPAMLQAVPSVSVRG